MNHNNNNRARYPPGMGLGRGGFNPNPSQNPNLNQNPSLNQNHHAFQARPPYHHQQQRVQYVQRHLLQQQQQQWLRRDGSAAVDEVEKTVQSEAVDSRCVCCGFRYIRCVVCNIYIMSWFRSILTVNYLDSILLIFY